MSNMSFSPKLWHSANFGAAVPLMWLLTQLHNFIRFFFHCLILICFLLFIVVLRSGTSINPLTTVVQKKYHDHVQPPLVPNMQRVRLSVKQQRATQGLNLRTRPMANIPIIMNEHKEWKWFGTCMATSMASNGTQVVTTVRETAPLIRHVMHSTFFPDQRQSITVIDIVRITFPWLH